MRTKLCAHAQVKDQARRLDSLICHPATKKRGGLGVDFRLG